METFLDNLLISLLVAPLAGLLGVLIGQFVILRYVPLEKVYLFLVRLSPGINTGLALEWCKDAMAHEPYCVEQIACIVPTTIAIIAIEDY